jgi:hypothetical protein
MTQTDPKAPRADQFQGDREAFQGASGDTMKAIVYTLRITGCASAQRGSKTYS